MKLKIMAMVVVASSSAFAHKALVKTEGTGGGAEVVRSAVTKGTEESKKELSKKLNEAQDGQVKAQEAEQRASEELSNNDNADVAYGKKAAGTIKRMLKDCGSGICNAFKTGISEVASKGNPKANTTLYNAITALKESRGNKEETLKESLKREGKDPKKVEDLCNPGA